MPSQANIPLPEGYQLQNYRVTKVLSAGGFSALLAKAPPTDEDVKVQLRLPGAEMLDARARVVGAIIQPAAVRVAFAFVGLGPAEKDRMEFLVFDTVLQQIKV